MRTEYNENKERRTMYHSIELQVYDFGNAYVVTPALNR